MTNGEAVNWLINVSADIGKAEHRDLWHYEQALYEIREMLESAQPEPQWIPCSERLPVEGESVLLCDRYGDMTLGRLVRTDEGYKWDIYAWWNDIDDWNAWMPLPEPWRGEEP